MKRDPRANKSTEHSLKVSVRSNYILMSDILFRFSDSPLRYVSPISFG